MLDSLFGTGKLEKMIISALKPIVKGQPPEVTGKLTDTYMVQVNPDSYSINHNVRYERNNTPGSAGDEPKFDHISPTSLDFSIIFDGTGIVPKSVGPLENALDNVPGVGAVVGAISGLLGNSEEYDVMKEIRKFATVVYDIDGGTHEPRKVRLTWGRQLYDGVLTSLSLNYKLFKPDGTPLRVEARLSFESVLFDIMNEAEVKKASPDLTHIRTVIAGDTLPLMAHDIYGKASYYIEVARANKIINFRKLREGRSVFFPPTKKTSE